MLTREYLKNLIFETEIDPIFQKKLTEVESGKITDKEIANNEFVIQSTIQRDTDRYHRMTYMILGIIQDSQPKSMACRKEVFETSINEAVLPQMNATIATNTIQKVKNIQGFKQYISEEVHAIMQIATSLTLRELERQKTKKSL